MSRYGWRPDTPDPRDQLMAAPRVAVLPDHVDLTPGCPPVYDQGELGSCTANAIAAALEYDLLKQGGKPFRPSRLFIYYFERAMEGTVNEDSGAEIRDGVKVVARKGAPPEWAWPYLPSRFAQMPSVEACALAMRFQALRYARVPQTRDALCAVLASGFPVVFGFTVYSSFESPAVAETGDAPMPRSGDAPVGGHAVLAVGYDRLADHVLVRNSWGASWGAKGYFTLPFEYVTAQALAQDFWVVRQVEDPAA